MKIWKMSHGWHRPEELSEREYLLNNNYVSTHIECGSLGGSAVTQGEYFCHHVEKGDYFYLCYSREVVLFGRFSDDKLLPYPEMSNMQFRKLKEQWYKRKYDKIADSFDRKHLYNGTDKWWTPNHNSTFCPIKDSELGLFEELILKPYFKLRLKDLQET